MRKGEPEIVEYETLKNRGQNTVFANVDRIRNFSWSLNPSRFSFF